MVRDGDVFTTYGPQVKIGPTYVCEKDQTTCGEVYTYTTGTEITSSTSVSVGVTVGVDEFVVATTTLEAGFEHSETSSESFSRSRNSNYTPGQ